MSDAKVVISRREDVPPQLLDDFTGTLSQLGIQFEIKPSERQIYNTLQYWAMTAVAAYLAKPFCESFLKKAGEDAYAQFKRGLAALCKKASQIKMVIIKAGQIKVPDVPRYSLVFSVYSQTSDSTTIKFLMPAQASEDEYLRTVDSLIAELQKHYESGPNDPLSAELGKEPDKRLKVLRHDPAANKWHLMTVKEAVDLERHKGVQE